MFDNKFLITLLGLIVAVVAVSKIKDQDEEETREEFLGNLPSFQTKVDVVQDIKGQMYSVPGTYQALLSPRMSAQLDYGANIRYNMPSIQNQAVPVHPLTFGNMALKGGQNYYENFQQKENYCGSGSCGSGGGPVTCGKGGIPESYHRGAPITEAGYGNGNYNAVLDKAYSGDAPDSANAPAHGMLPVRDMSSMDSAAERGEGQVFTYDRFIYANRNSRLRSQGDPIRGDLAVVPCAGGWFRPSVQPNIDLQQGAMFVLGGSNMQSNNELANLIVSSSGNSQRVVSGINMDNSQVDTARAIANGLNPNAGLNMANQLGGGYSNAAQSSVNVTAFP